MIFSLEALQAKEGDCLLLHFGTQLEPKLAVIDGGPGGVYDDFLRPRLEEIRAQADPLPLEFVMVSHVDDDHVVGVLAMAQELVETKSDGDPLPYEVKTLWHNAFDQITANDPDAVTAAIQAAFGAAALGGTPPDRPDIDSDVAAILASVKKGNQLRKDAKTLEWIVNAPTDDELVRADESADPILEFGGGIELTVVGPMADELKRLQAKFKSFFKTHPAEAALAASKDGSVANLSSIVVVVATDDSSILLTGDARGDKIIEGLELVKLLDADDDTTAVHISVLKMAHHGSIRNVEPGFFSRVLADHYVASGDGKHENPDRETFELLFDERPDASFTIHLTYPVDEIDARREEEWGKLFDRGKKDRAWDDDLDALATLFAEQEAAGHRFTLATGAPDQPIRIDLEDDPFFV